MPFLPTAQEWLAQSALLLQARPTTTRITTKYSLISPTKSVSAIKKAEVRARKPLRASETATEAPTAPTTQATLTLKTYDPVSGTTLKYETDKAAEVGRLVLGLSSLGRGMAGLPELKEDVDMGGGGGEAEAPVMETKAAPAAQTAGGGKRKKKGKK